MPLPVDVLASEILRLPGPERLQLLTQLVDSLEEDAERDARWEAIAAARDTQADADSSVLVPAAEALARIRTDVA
jgi:hypothetical protein